MTGYVHSVETFGLLDGPGVRVVIFLQGCPLRCSFCHNPDTWLPNLNKEMSPEEVLELVLKYKSYFKNNGGVTFSGGEPLFQGKFLANCLKLLKENDIHTCIDTCGVGNNIEEVLKYTDLALYDIKALDRDKYKDLVNYDIDNSLNFLKLAENTNTKLWIRQVIIPNYNDNEEYINELAQYIKTIKNVELIELLPYHNSAINKYKELNIPYSLIDTPNMDIEECKRLETILRVKVNS